LILLIAHLPLAVLEGVVLGFTVGFLARVKPAMLGWTDSSGGMAHDPADPHEHTDDVASLVRSGAGP
jgi:hypothetical protein